MSISLSGLTSGQVTLVQQTQPSAAQQAATSSSQSTSGNTSSASTPSLWDVSKLLSSELAAFLAQLGSAPQQQASTDPTSTDPSSVASASSAGAVTGSADAQQQGATTASAAGPLAAIGDDFAALLSSVQSGDTSGTQADLTKLKQDIGTATGTGQASGAAGHHHHGHHGGGTASSTDATASLFAPTTDASAADAISSDPLLATATTNAFADFASAMAATSGDGSLDATQT